jgi:hypothetical protein
MPTEQSFSGTKSLNLKEGLIRFAETYSSDPFQDDEMGFWVRTSDNRLMFSRLGEVTEVQGTSTSPSFSPSLSPSKSPSLSPSVSPSNSVSPSVSLSPSLSPSVSPSVSVSPSGSLSPSVSPSASPT